MTRSWSSLEACSPDHAHFDASRPRESRWRCWCYYGLPLPSTYYAKALIPIVSRASGWNYAHEELTATGVMVMVPFLFLLAHRLARPVWMLLFFAAGHIAYVIRVGGDWMPFARFFIPIVPIGCVLCVWAVADFAVRARALRRFPRVLHAAAVLIGLAALGHVAVRTNNPWGNPDDKKREHIAQAIENGAHVDRLRRAAEMPGPSLNMVDTIRLLQETFTTGC